jgi:Flp pilus assembly protein TadD
MNRCKACTALLGLLLLPSVAAAAEPAKDAFKKGKVCFEEGDFDGALAAFTEAIRLDPKSAAALTERGRAYAMKRDCDKAIGDYTAAIRLDPQLATCVICSTQNVLI